MIASEKIGIVLSLSILYPIDVSAVVSFTTVVIALLAHIGVMLMMGGGRMPLGPERPLSEARV